MYGCYEHGNESLGSIKCWEIHEYLRDWRYLKKVSGPYSLFLTAVQIGSGGFRTLGK
jgi:hypothetical protein